MLKLTRKISASGLLHPRALAPLLAGIGAIAVVALLTPGGHERLAAVGAGAREARPGAHARPVEPGRHRKGCVRRTGAAGRARRGARCGASRGARSTPRPRRDRGGGGVRPRGVGRCDRRRRSALRSARRTTTPCSSSTARPRPSWPRWSCWRFRTGISRWARGCRSSIPGFRTPVRSRCGCCST